MIDTFLYLLLIEFSLDSEIKKILKSTSSDRNVENDSSLFYRVSTYVPQTGKSYDFEAIVSKQLNMLEVHITHGSDAVFRDILIDILHFRHIIKKPVPARGFYQVDSSIPVRVRVLVQDRT